MIIVRTPLRLSIAGGGTDLPAWYKNHGSMFISAAINKYIYITIQQNNYSEKINLRYSETEEVDNIDEIKHNIIRETLRLFPQRGGINITSHADIPSGTGLGSSGSFGVAIVHALNQNATPNFLADKSTEIQKDILGFPIGLQDQYAAAYGGINAYTINKKGQIRIEEIKAHYLQEKLALFYTGIKRDANAILAHSTLEGLEEVQSIGFRVREALAGMLEGNYGVLMDEHWQQKKKRHPEMSNPKIDGLYRLGKQNGAIGGKLIGAGGGGFLLFYTNNREKLIKAMPLTHQPFLWDTEGSKIIYYD